VHGSAQDFRVLLGHVLARELFTGKAYSLSGELGASLEHSEGAFADVFRCNAGELLVAHWE
jgi:hypothetical protein